jgi:hypothetical protein
MRHEPMREVRRQTVFNDLVKWMRQRVDGE